MADILDRQFDVIDEENKSILPALPVRLYEAINITSSNARVGFICVGIPKADTVIVRRVDSFDGNGNPTSYTDFTRTTGVPTGTTFFVDSKFDSAQILVDATELGSTFEVSGENLGTPLRAEVISDIQKDTILKLSPIAGVIRDNVASASNTSRIWNAQTISLNAGIAQVANLEINGLCHLRANVTNSTGILEVFGNITFAPGAELRLYKVLLIVHGDVIGDAVSPGIISSPNGANGGNAWNSGSNAIAELGGLGGSPASSGDPRGGGGGGGAGNGGSGASGSSTGGTGGIGAGGGGSIFGSGGSGGIGSEASYISNGGNGGSGFSPAGAGGGGGAAWIRLVFFGIIANVIARTGKGGIAGSSQNNNSQGGQSGSIRAFFQKSQLTNVQFDVRAGTSTGNATRDGSAGNLRLHDMETWEHCYMDGVSTVQDESSLTFIYNQTEDYSTRFQAQIINESGYYTKSGAAI